MSKLFYIFLSLFFFIPSAFSANRTQEVLEEIKQINFQSTQIFSELQGLSGTALVVLILIILFVIFFLHTPSTWLISRIMGFSKTDYMRAFICNVIYLVLISIIMPLFIKTLGARISMFELYILATYVIMIITKGIAILISFQETIKKCVIAAIAEMLLIFLIGICISQII